MSDHDKQITSLTPARHRVAVTQLINDERRRAVGENLGFGTGPFSTPREIVKDWMNSPGHRANILKPWQFGAVWSSRTGGEGVTVVQHFGRNVK